MVRNDCSRFAPPDCPSSDGLSTRLRPEPSSSYGRALACAVAGNRGMMRPTFKIWVLRVAAAFALVWSILRAVQQAITLDEADTYLWFGSREAKFIWYPLPNNHVLNSLLIW